MQADGSLAANVHGIQFPRGVILAIDGLPIWSDSKKCMQCGHIRRLSQHIQQHCRLEHGWVNLRKRGGRLGARPASGLGQAWVDGVHCQRFGQDGPLQRLFEVAPPADRVGAGVDGDSSGSSAWKAIEAAFEASAQAIKQKDETAAALISEQSRLSANMWVRRTGWPQHLCRFDREWLAATTQKPEPEKEGVEDRGEDRGEGEGLDREAETADETYSEAALAVALLAVERVI